MLPAMPFTGFSEKEALEMFPLIDKDGSGTISFDEFR
jgi:Ca2+-binding EF-hand superfamily protein